MKNETWLKRLIFAGGGLCALCCLLPVIGLSAGAVGLGGTAFYLEKAAAGLLIITAAAFLIMMFSKRKRSVCADGCGCNSCRSAIDAG